MKMKAFGGTAISDLETEANYTNVFIKAHHNLQSLVEQIKDISNLLIDAQKHIDNASIEHMKQ